MLKKILYFISFITVFSLVFSLPLAALAQDAGMTAPLPETIPPPPSSYPSSGGDQMMNQQPMYQQPMMGPDTTSFGPGSTCNVNGVDMPGSCQDRQGMYGPQMGPGMEGGGQGMQMGPTEEEMQKMEAQREEMAKKMRGRGMQQMKRGLKQFAQGLKQVESRIAKLEKQNVTVPADLKEKIAKVKIAVDAIMAAEDPEEVMEELEAVQSMGEEMGNLMPRLEMLARLPQMIKKAESEIKRMEKSYVSVSKKAQRAKIDVSTILAKWQELIDELKTALAEAKAGQFSEDEDPMQIIGEGIFERLEETWRYHQTINMVLDIKRNLKQVGADLKKYEKIITRLEKKGEDMSEARGILEELQVKYQEVSEAVSGGLEPEELEEVIGDLDYYMEAQEQLEKLLDLGGPSLFEQQMKSPMQGGRMPKFNVPNIQQMMDNTQNLDQAIAQAWAEEQDRLYANLQAEKIQKLQALAALLKAVRTRVVDLTERGVTMPTDLKEGILTTLAALSAPTAVAQEGLLNTLGVLSTPTAVVQR